MTCPRIPDTVLARSHVRNFLRTSSCGPGKHHAALYQVDRTRAKTRPSATAAPLCTSCSGISPSYLDSLEISLGLARVTSYFWTAGRAKKEEYSGEGARGGETFAPP